MFCSPAAQAVHPSAFCSPPPRSIHLADRNLTFKGAHEWRYPRYRAQANVANPTIEQNNEKLFRLLVDGRLHTEPLLTHLVRPEEAVGAYQALRALDEDYLGVVIDWGTEEN